MSRRYLLSTPEGLKRLQRKVPWTGIRGNYNFVSTELAFADAQSAHELQELLSELYHAAARIHRRAKVAEGKASNRGERYLADLKSALRRAQDWV